jgi:hypothetical protein
MKDVELNADAYCSNTSICLYISEDLKIDREREQRLPHASSTSSQHGA